MKRFGALIGAAMLVGLAGTAQAQNWYVGGYGALNYTHDGFANGNDRLTYDLGYGLGGYAGYAMANGLRLEGEILYRANDIDTFNGAPVGSDLSSLAIMGNVLFDIEAGPSLTPHIGAGLGIADATLETGGLEFSNTVLAAQLIAGVDFKMAPDLAFTVDYRLFFTEDLGFGAGSGLGSVEYVNSAVSAGLRKSF